MAFIRQTAHVCQIKDILEGDYVKKAGWESNYVRTKRGDVSRVNIICAVVGKDDQGVLLDDGTGSIQGKTAENSLLDNTLIGDVVLVIGKVREFENRYLMLELIKPIDHDWVAYRKKLLERFPVRDLKRTAATPLAETTVQESGEGTLLQALKALDKGEGVTITALKATCPDLKVECILDELLKEGEVFELKPGVIKAL